VVQSRIQYLADWSIAHWAKLPDGGFSEAFEVVVDDPEARLTVLRRR